MQQDGSNAEDGPERSEIYCKKRWLLGKLEHLTGKYILARNSNDNSLLTQEIEMSFPIQVYTFYMTGTVKT